MTPRLSEKLKVFGVPEESAVEQIENVLQDARAVKGALMADNHKGYSMPIGGVVAYKDAISPTGVGFDIACGNMAVKTAINIFELGILDTSSSDFHMQVDPDVLKPIMREIQKKVSFGMGRSREDVTNQWILDHSLWANPIWIEIDKYFGGSALWQKARAQLGTVGSGNHYVDLLVDTSGHIWVANHFGSRGLGHTIASGFMAKAAGLDFTDRVKESEEAVVLDTVTDLGQFYIECMKLAGEYAYAGREYVTGTVLDILGTDAIQTVHNHHNFAWLENDLWVVRKGATPLTTQPAFIGGSMGDVSVIVRGRRLAAPEITNWVEDIGNIDSAPHGAGRVMSRTQAAGKLRNYLACTLCSFAERNLNGELFKGEVCPNCFKGTLKKARLRDTSTAQIDWDGVRADLTDRGIVVLGAGADEAPGVYKDLSTVLAAHSNIEILESLRPIGVVMAGADEFDPYKD
jgi:tRNA-splicing ligase RtcB (3'-phosphate/5'-hydroxy nucleic acid ligase)